MPRTSRERRARRSARVLLVAIGLSIAAVSLQVGTDDETAAPSQRLSTTDGHVRQQSVELVSKKKSAKKQRQRSKRVARPTKKATPVSTSRSKTIAPKVVTRPKRVPVAPKATVSAPKPVSTTPAAPSASPSVPAVPTTSPTVAQGTPATGSALVDGLVYGLPSLGFVQARNAFGVDISTAPVNPDSAGMVANLATQVSTVYGGIAAFNVWNYNVSFVKAPPGTPRQRVVWDNCQQKSYVPSQLYTSSAGAHFVNVPIPSDATPSAGTDGELTIWDPSTDQVWELWKANKQADGWHACWGGRIDNWSTSIGAFPNGMGASASGLAVAPGVVTMREGQTGQINHALALAIRSVANWKTFSYPAQRSDGNEPLGAAHAIPEGTRFRLDPTLNVDKLKLTPVARSIAKAAQRYGFIVTDKAGAVSVVAESGNATATVTGTDPWKKTLNGTPGYLVMKDFPWDRLQALPFDYGKP